MDIVMVIPRGSVLYHRPSIPANKLHSLLAKHVIEDMRASSTVESLAFK